MSDEQLNEILSRADALGEIVKNVGTDAFAKMAEAIWWQALGVVFGIGAGLVLFVMCCVLFILADRTDSDGFSVTAIMGAIGSLIIVAICTIVFLVEGFTALFMPEGALLLRLLS